MTLAALLLSALFPAPAHRLPHEGAASRAGAISNYAALTSYTMPPRSSCGREENVRYTLRFDADAEETSHRPRAGAARGRDGAPHHRYAQARIRRPLCFDAGGTPGGVSAVTCAPFALRAAGEGWLTERSEEEIEYGGRTVRALRLCFESEAGGETIQCTLWFGADDAPLRAEIAEKDKITAYMEFTGFCF